MEVFQLSASWRNHIIFGKALSTPLSLIVVIKINFGFMLLIDILIYTIVFFIVIIIIMRLRIYTASVSFAIQI